MCSRSNHWDLSLPHTNRNEDGRVAQIQPSQQVNSFQEEINKDAWKRARKWMSPKVACLDSLCPPGIFTFCRRSSRPRDFQENGFVALRHADTKLSLPYSSKQVLLRLISLQFSSRLVLVAPKGNLTGCHQHVILERNLTSSHWRLGHVLERNSLHPVHCFHLPCGAGSQQRGEHKEDERRRRRARAEPRRGKATAPFQTRRRQPRLKAGRKRQRGSAAGVSASTTITTTASANASTTCSRVGSGGRIGE